MFTGHASSIKLRRSNVYRRECSHGQNGVLEAKENEYRGHLLEAEPGAAAQERHVSEQQGGLWG